MPESFKQPVGVRGTIPLLANILLWDDFEGTLRWEGSGNAGDWLVDKVSDVSYMGNHGLCIATRATSPATGDWAEAKRRVYLIPSQTFQISMHFLMEDHTKIDYIEGMGTFYDGLFKYQAGMRSFPNTGKLFLLYSDGNWYDSGAPVAFFASGAWHRFSASFDFVQKEYIGGGIDQRAAEFPGLPLYSVSDTSSRMEYFFTLRVVTVGAAQARLTLDTALFEAI